jgi:hypothetical protein
MISHDDYCNLHKYNYIYNIDENSSKYTSYGYQLIKIIESILDKYKTSIIKDEEYQEATNQRLIDYIVMRIINIGHYYKNLYTFESFEYEKTLLKKLKNLLEVEDQVLNKIFLITKTICINYDKTDPSPNQKNKIRSTAKAKGHNCYICGRKLDADKQTDLKKAQIKEKHEKGEYKYNLLEIEHILPRTYGGGLNKENITVACENCNKLKDDKLSYSNCYFEGFLPNNDKEVTIKSKLTKDLKFSLLYKQKFKCANCNVKFYNLENENFVFYKKENDEPFHFTNVLVCCEKCSDKNQIEGIKNGTFI